MIKRDLLKEIENGLKIVKEAIDEGILNNNIDEAFKVINKKMKEMVGVDIDTINTVSFDTIKSMISTGFENNSDKYIALGMLLKFEGDLYGKKEDISNQIFYYITSISSFNEAFELDDTYIDNYRSHMTEMVNEVKKYELTYEEKLEVTKICNILK